MGITENAAYLKGLFDGYELDKTTKEGKIIGEMLNLIADMADKIVALENDNNFFVREGYTVRAIDGNPYPEYIVYVEGTDEVAKYCCNK